MPREDTFRLSKCRKTASYGSNNLIGVYQWIKWCFYRFQTQSNIYLYKFPAANLINNGIQIENGLPLPTGKRNAIWNIFRNRLLRMTLPSHKVKSIDMKSTSRYQCCIDIQNAILLGNCHLPKLYHFIATLIIFAYVCNCKREFAVSKEKLKGFLTILSHSSRYMQSNWQPMLLIDFVLNQCTFFPSFVESCEREETSKMEFKLQQLHQHQQ